MEILGLFVTAIHTTSYVLVNVEQLDTQLYEMANMEWPIFSNKMKQN